MWEVDMNGSKAFATTKTIVEKAIDVLSVVLFIVIFVLGLMQIFWRWVLNDPLAWSEEASVDLCVDMLSRLG
jgi:TRAP-type C4-dicarboxylate transport system permease small subunit